MTYAYLFANFFEALWFLYLYTDQLPRRCDRPLIAHGRWGRLAVNFLFIICYMFVRRYFQNDIVWGIFVAVLMEAIYLWYNVSLKMTDIIWLTVMYELIMGIAKSAIYSIPSCFGILTSTLSVSGWLLRIFCAGLKGLLILPLRQHIRALAPGQIGRIEMITLVLPLFCRYASILLSKYFGDDQITAVAVFALSICIYIAILAMWWHLSYTRSMEDVKSLEVAMESQYQENIRKTEAEQAVMSMYHDIKKQLIGIRSLVDNNELQGMVSDIDRKIESYEMIAHTDNQVLNAILNEKAREAKQKDIGMEIFHSSENFSFLSNTDVCSIFGNALDNAIEAAQLEPLQEKRVISLKSGRIANMLVLRIDNYFTRPLKKKGPQFLTTKPQPEQHGFGLKYIEYSVHKYGGKVSIETQEDLFILKIIFPIP